ncbi:hypothetical protein [Sphingomonas sp. 1P08PE]|uniref:hypothetical protein n=1 Tax=Sphingomonas sp. 1P08PE TaxID=554122 RepID=UPI0039A23BD6
MRMLRAMKALLLALLHAPRRIGERYAAIRRMQDRAVDGECRFCGAPAVEGTDRCAECRDTIVL